MLWVVIGTVRADAVGCAIDKEGKGLGGVFGDVDGGEEFDAVPHRDAVFVLGVVFADFGGGGGVGVVIGGSGGCRESEKDCENCDAAGEERSTQDGGHWGILCDEDVSAHHNTCGETEGQ